jgi:hypothetical protein
MNRATIICAAGICTSSIGTIRSAAAAARGFSEHLPYGRGLFAVRTVEEAAAAIEEIERDYMAHATAAREVAAGQQKGAR